MPVSCWSQLGINLMSTGCQLYVNFMSTWCQLYRFRWPEPTTTPLLPLGGPRYHQAELTRGPTARWLEHVTVTIITTTTTTTTNVTTTSPSPSPPTGCSEKKTVFFSGVSKNAGRLVLRLAVPKNAGNVLFQAFPSRKWTSPWGGSLPIWKRLKKKNITCIFRNSQS